MRGEMVRRPPRLVAVGRHTKYDSPYDDASFRVADDDAAEAQRWATALGVDRSELLREALHRHLAALRADGDAVKWEQAPATDAELSLASIAEWGPAEDWSDSDDAAR